MSWEEHRNGSQDTCVPAIGLVPHECVVFGQSPLASVFSSVKQGQWFLLLKAFVKMKWKKCENPL